MSRKSFVLFVVMVAALGLVLVALFAPSAHAQQITVEVNPGEPCNPTKNLKFGTEEDASMIDVLFEDNKTAKYEMGEHSFRLKPFSSELGGDGGNYVGLLLDAAGKVISGTFFFGSFPSDTSIHGDPAILNLDQPTVFGGMRFIAALDGGPGLPASTDYALSWVSSPKPTVIPEGGPVTIGGTVTGLVGSGLVLQNNGADDLPIDTDDPFAFDTPLEPCRTYNVTVSTNPTNPIQFCSVENGSGDVGTENVTDVAVTCVEPELTATKKVAAVGDTVDDTVLTDILLNGGVAIDPNGIVAFGGRDSNGTKAVFGQWVKVVGEGDTLADDTILAAFREQGEVAIGDRGNGQMRAFHGMAETGEIDTPAVFTEDGVVAKVGDTISTASGGTLVDIDPVGKVAINNWTNQVAFHGKLEIPESLNSVRAVFYAQEGVSTRVAAREASTLTDDTPLDLIIDSAGVAINEYGEVAFWGQTGTVRAVFTQDKVIAQSGTYLLDGNILEYINENGGVAINLFGEVAFHGRTLGVKAVFIGDGETTEVVAKVGDILPDGKTLTGIEVSGGVAINDNGEVAFHGRTDEGKAVFTPNGVVAKVGDFLNDGDPLSDIWTGGGVAINDNGEVVFHGQAGSNRAVTDAVLVGLAPEETVDTEPTTFGYGADMVGK